MINGVIVKELKKYEDERGWLAEIFRNDETDYLLAMAYVSVTKSGIIRGPHEHEKQSDCFVFLGPGKFILHLWDRRVDSGSEGEYIKIEAGEDKPTLIIVPAGVVHGYKCVSQNEGWCINLPDKLYKGQGKKDEVDEIRWEEKEDSPYRIT